MPFPRPRPLMGQPEPPTEAADKVTVFFVKNIHFVNVNITLFFILKANKPLRRQVSIWYWTFQTVRWQGTQSANKWKRPLTLKPGPTWAPKLPWDGTNISGSRCTGISRCDGWPRREFSGTSDHTLFCKLKMLPLLCDRFPALGWWGVPESHSACWSLLVSGHLPQSSLTPQSDSSLCLFFSQ